MTSNRDRRPRSAQNLGQKGAADEYPQSPLAPNCGGAGPQVEAEHVDRGGGRRSWFVVRHGDQVWSCAGRGEPVAFLEEHGVAPGDIAAPEAGLPPSQDGCE
jgi:hypothetical protein